MGVSTSDGEYVTTTGLIPKSGVWSYSESSDNAMPFAFGHQFRALGYRTMAFHDWAEKKQYLPVIDYLKTDAAEAEILTGLTDRAEAAKLLHSWGAKEVLITHNTEVRPTTG